MEDTKENNTQLIEEMMRDAEKAAEPGDIIKNRVIHKGDDEAPSPMVAMKVESAGWVYIYDTRTFERSLTNRNMLPGQLKKKRLDGSLVFTTIKPTHLPKRGGLKCMLHADNTNRGKYDEMGLAVCEKCNLTSDYQVKRHMMKRHPAEWETIEDARKDLERRDDMAERKALRATLYGRASATTDAVEPPLYVSDKDSKAVLAT